METFNSILDEIQKNEDIGTVAAFADKIKISSAQLSRIKSNKAPLTDNVINKIYEYFAENDKEYADKLKERLEKIKLESSQSAEQETKSGGTGNSAVDEYTKLIEKISQEDNLLMLEYRDFPVTLGLFPDIKELSVKAVKSGLCVAMLQPFGSREALLKKQTLLAEKTLDIKDLDLCEIADQIINSYGYLIRLAGKVNRLYQAIKNELDSNEKGQVVLYEATYKTGSKNASALPSIVASGITSKLLYADFFDSDQRQRQVKVYEWTSVPNDNFLFIERGNTTLNFNAIKMQFNPIPTYWEKNRRLPETEGEMNKAYKEFGSLNLFGEEEIIKWKIWSPE